MNVGRGRERRLGWNCCFFWLVQKMNQQWRMAFCKKDWEEKEVGQVPDLQGKDNNGLCWLWRHLLCWQQTHSSLMQIVCQIWKQALCWSASTKTGSWARKWTKGIWQMFEDTACKQQCHLACQQIQLEWVSPKCQSCVIVDLLWNIDGCSPFSFSSFMHISQLPS